MEIVELLQPGVSLPRVDRALRATWLAAVHEAMRSVGGAVTDSPDDPCTGRNYYRVEVTTRDGSTSLVVLNAAATLVAAAELPERGRYILRFVAVPASDVFSARGFHVAGPAELDEPLLERHVQGLTAAELYDVGYHRPDRLGDLLYNWFD